MPGPDTPNNLIRLVLIECASPLDALKARSELTVVAGVAKMVGHSVWGTNVLSRRSFKETCRYVASMCRVTDSQPDAPLCIHVSAHGDADGLLFGGDDVSWSQLLEDIQPILTADYAGPRVLVISACHADQQRLTKEITKRVRIKKKLCPPHYVFCCTGAVAWRDAAMAWTMLYHRMTSLQLAEKASIKQMLNAIKQLGVAGIVYWRWDKNAREYKRYVGE
jgi:hypothetical protein